jgi:alkylated DNA repair dioxygenase AlkB
MYDLFNSGTPSNLLPFDGSAELYHKWLTVQESEHYFKALLNTIDWRQDEIMMFGKRIITSRKVGWYGDSPFRYIYSKTEKVAMPWTVELADLKSRIELLSGARFNSCLLNLYHNGSEGMGWHADDEKSLDPSAPIASISLGATRTFRFKHKSREYKTSIELPSGSLLLMNPPTQEFWLHTLTKTTRINSPRINLTFRLMLPQ